MTITIKSTDTKVRCNSTITLLSTYNIFCRRISKEQFNVAAFSIDPGLKVSYKVLEVTEALDPRSIIIAVHVQFPMVT
jgi:hypothetical protein